MIRLTLFAVLVWMGDVILLYRLYRVSGKHIQYIIVPCITCVLTVVCSCNYIHLVAVGSLQVPGSLTRIRDWCISTFVITLTENAYCAAVIAFHIWRSHREVRSPTQSNLGPILRIVIESAAPWIVFILITFILYVANTSVYLTVLYLSNPVLGISFCLMTARLNLRTRDTSNSGGNIGGSSGSTPYGSGGVKNQPGQPVFFNAAQFSTRATTDSVRSIPLEDMQYSSERKETPEPFEPSHIV